MGSCSRGSVSRAVWRVSIPVEYTAEGGGGLKATRPPGGVIWMDQEPTRARLLCKVSAAKATVR